MRIFAISDLHLAFSTDKPMDIFGSGWEGHFDKIKKDWQEKVSDEDLVLIAGDISWAMTLGEAKKDLGELRKLNGKIVIIRGNHDYWWSSLTKVKKILPPNIYCIQNDALKFGDFIICGTRGWTVNEKDLEGENQKYINRECIRLKMSLDNAKKLQNNNQKIVVMMHYPPFNSKFEDSPFTDIISKYDISTVIYGHLHGENIRYKPIVNKGKTNYYLTSCDFLKFELLDMTDKL